MIVARRAREAVLRAAYRVAYHLMTIDARVRRPQGRGVKCVLAYGDTLVLVRHTYGPRRTWHIPGGGVHRGEALIVAGQREMREELGIRDVPFHLLSEMEMDLHHRRVKVACVHAELATTALTRDRVEIAEARFFPHDALPTPLGGEVRSLVRLAFAPEAIRERQTVEE